MSDKKNQFKDELRSMLEQEVISKEAYLLLKKLAKDIDRSIVTGNRNKIRRAVDKFAKKLSESISEE